MPSFSTTPPVALDSGIHLTMPSRGDADYDSSLALTDDISCCSMSALLAEDCHVRHPQSIRVLTLIFRQLKELNLTWATLIGMQCTTPQIVAIPHFHQPGLYGPILNHDLWASTNHGFLTTVVCLCPQQEIFVVVAYEDQAYVPRPYGNHLLSQMANPFEVWRGNVLVFGVDTNASVRPTHPLLALLMFRFSSAGLRIG